MMPTFDARGLIAAAIVGAVAAGVLAPIRPAVAADPVIIQRLSQEATTLFDMGMKRLRRLALDAAQRFTPPGASTTTSRVWYRPETATIELLFQMRSPQTPPTAQQCLETRRRAISETFLIGRTLYATNLSFGERVRRRLGLIFAHEPLQNGKEVIAIGERLAELTFVEVAFIDPQGNVVRNCRDGAAAQPPQ